MRIERWQSASRAAPICVLAARRYLLSILSFLGMKLRPCHKGFVIGSCPCDWLERTGDVNPEDLITVGKSDHYIKRPWCYDLHKARIPLASFMMTRTWNSISRPRSRQFQVIFIGLFPRTSRSTPVMKQMKPCDGSAGSIRRYQRGRT